MSALDIAGAGTALVIGGFCLYSLSWLIKNNASNRDAFFLVTGGSIICWAWLLFCISRLLGARF